MEEFLKDSPSEFGSNYNLDKVVNRSNADDLNSEQNIEFLNTGDKPYYGPFEKTNEQNGNEIFANLSKKDEPTYYRDEPSNENFGFVNADQDKLFEDLDTLQYSQQQPQYMNFSQSQTTNLDELLSPQSLNAVPEMTINEPESKFSFLTPQYLSPPTNAGGAGALSSINEDAGSISNVFSPLGSRHGSVSAPFSGENYTGGVDIDAGSYLSPSHNVQYMSPPVESSLDAFKSPSFNSASYLNSPPFAFTNTKYDTANTSNSIPKKSLAESYPYSAKSMGTSLPDSGQNDFANGSKQLSKEEKLKRRREFHNAVERRRRDLIKERIKELGMIVPPSMLNPQLSAVQNLSQNSSQNSKELNELISSAKVKETKPNKSTILNKSVDYIKHLQYVLEMQAKSREELNNRLNALEGKVDSVSASMPISNNYQYSNSKEIGPELKLENNSSNYDPNDFFSESLSNEDTGLLT